MYKSAILLFGLTIGLISPPAITQAPVEKIAYDTCYYYWDGGYYSCYIQVANVDGTDAISMPNEASDPAWSPDGSRIAFADIWGNGIFVWNPEDGSITELAPGYYYSWSPTWAPDGQRVAFSNAPWGPAELFASLGDGSVAQLTDQNGFIGLPAWSPDGARIAFDCEIVPGNLDICAIELATRAVTRLTTDSASDSGAAWSPDGTRLAFATTRFGGVSEIALMNADGSAVSRIGSGLAGQQPVWSPGGNRLAFMTPGGPCDEFGYCMNVINLVNIDGTGQTVFGYGLNVAWTTSTVEFGRPIAYTYFSCTGLTCSFNGSGSWDPNGQITGHSWNFGDGGSASGDVISHAFPAAGTYSVTLTVVDNSGLEATTTTSVTVVVPPQAVAAVSCSGLTCSFNGSASSDADGTIVSHVWTFGDGTQASGPVVTHTYTSGGVFQISLRVTDNGGAIGITYTSVTVSMSPHVGDLDGSSTGLRDKWTAGVTATVHDANHQPMSSVTVNGTWSNGAASSCTTNGVGQCMLFLYQLKNSVANVTFTVTGLQVAYGTYAAAANHDPESDSNGTRITVKKK